MKNKGEHKIDYVYVVTGLTDVKYNKNVDNSYIKFGDTNILGIFTDYNEFLSYIDSYDEDEPIYNLDTEMSFKYLIVDSSLINDFIGITTESFTSIQYKSIYKWNDESKKYELYTQKDADPEFIKIYNEFMQNDDFYEVISVPSINLHNIEFIMHDDDIMINRIKILDIDFMNTNNVIDDEKLNETFMDFFGEFLSQPNNKLVIQDKEIKSVDDITDDMKEDAKELYKMIVDVERN